MKAGFTYRHQDCSDAAILVMEVQAYDKKRVSLRVAWMNCVNPKNLFPCGLVETIEIEREDLSKWKQI